MTHLEIYLYEALDGLVKDIAGQQKHCGHDFDCICAMEEAKSALRTFKYRDFDERVQDMREGI